MYNFRYDGQRAQIHKMPNGTVRIYSRNGDETTSRFPDLIKIIEESCKPAAVTLIVDAEVIYFAVESFLVLFVNFI
jgi:DNA ligase-1